jgi:hypothetical protein
MGDVDRFVNPLEVGQVNRLLAEFAERYYFAKDLEKCPIHRRTIPRQLWHTSRKFGTEVD